MRGTPYVVVDWAKVVKVPQTSPKPMKSLQRVPSRTPLITSSGSVTPSSAVTSVKRGGY